MAKNKTVTCPIFVLAISLVISANALIVVYANESKNTTTIGDEMDGFQLDFESHRRILANDSTNSTNSIGRFISYAALTQNSIPCSVAGASYYNCQVGAQANPYTRSCTEITRCARE